MLNHHEKGQSLIEVLMVLMVATIILMSISVVILNSLKNSQFAQNQINATKLAQDSIDKIKTIRDRNQDEAVSFDGNKYKFGDLWDIFMSDACEVSGVPGPCYFTLVTDSTLKSDETVQQWENIGEGFSRQILFEDDASSYQKEKKITVKIKWTDASGDHESNLQTILTDH